MGKPWEITNPTYFRNGVNVGAADIAVGLVLKRSTTTEQGIDAATSPTDSFAGVSAEAHPVGLARSVQVDGVAICTSGAAITIGDFLTVDSLSRVIKATSATQNIIGIAITAATAANQSISVELTKQGVGSNTGVIKRSVRVQYTDLSAAALTQDFSLGAAVPTGARLLGYRMTRDVGFVKGAQTFTGSIGIAATPTKVAAATDIVATGESTAAVGMKDVGGDAWIARITTNTGTLASSTAGDCTFEAFFAVP